MCQFLLLSIFRKKIRMQPSSWWNWEFLATGATLSIPASIASGYMESQSLNPSQCHTCASWLPQVLRLKSDKGSARKESSKGCSYVRSGHSRATLGLNWLSVCRGRKGLLNLVFYKLLFNMCFLFLKSLCSLYFPHTPPHKQKWLSFGKLCHDSLVGLMPYP